jgi:hypothetical protein
VIAVHHTGKDEDRGSRGSTNLPAAVDTEIQFDRNNDLNMPVATVIKQRDGETGDKFAFTLQVEQLGLFDQYGDPVTSCVVIPNDFVPNKTPKKLKNPKQEQALELLRLAIADKSTLRVAEGMDTETAMVELDVWREDIKVAGVFRDSPPIPNDTPEKAAGRFRTAFKRVKDALEAAGRIAITNDDWVYATLPIEALVPSFVRDVTKGNGVNGTSTSAVSDEERVPDVEQISGALPF